MLPNTMAAVVAYGKGDYRYEQIPTPRAEGVDIILEVEACGVCAGDLKCFEGGSRFWGGGGNSAFVEPPFIPGHELLGRVAELGPDYAGPFKVGDRITSEQLVPCGVCRYCKEGSYWLCDPHNVYGFKHHLNGGFAQYVRLPKGSLNYKVPDDMPLKQAILIEPYACSLHAVDRAKIKKDDVVVIAGAGTLGLGMITAAAQLKPRALISIEPVAWLRDLALKMGATHTMDAWTENGVAPLIADMTGGTGCDVYIEASGHPSAVSQGLQLIKKGGHFVEFSVFNAPATVDWSLIGDVKELDIYGVSLSPYCFERAIEGIYNGSYKTDGVVTHVLPLADYEKAFELSKNRQGLKIALTP
jgi:threonine dehydrogenase-like Zn-dependent dehydrogenase